MSVKSYLNKHNTIRQVLFFIVIGQTALLAQILSRIGVDIMLRSLDGTVSIPPFPEQPVGSFMAFLVSNIIAKVLSYILNRKKTFRATGNAVPGAVIYTILVVVLIVVETIVGTPMQNFFYILFHGTFSGNAPTTATVLDPGLYQLCGTLSVLTCGLMDSIIVFLMSKYVIMRSS